jgi:hypothetical protein
MAPHKSYLSIKCEIITDLTIYHFIYEWGYIYDNILIKLTNTEKKDRLEENNTLTRAKLFHFNVNILSYSYEIVTLLFQGPTLE